MNGYSSNNNLTNRQVPTIQFTMVNVFATNKKQVSILQTILHSYQNCTNIISFMGLEHHIYYYSTITGQEIIHCNICAGLRLL